MSSSFLCLSRWRLWVACVALSACLSLAAWVMYLAEIDALVNKGSYTFPSPVHVAGFVLDLPGLYGTMVLGGSPHGGGLGGWRDLLVIPAVSGVFWRTPLWAVMLMLRAMIRRRAARQP